MFHSSRSRAGVREQFAVALAAPFSFDVNLDNLRLRNGCERSGRRGPAFAYPRRFLLHSVPAPVAQHGSDHPATSDFGQSEKIASSKRARAATVKRRSFSVRAFPLLGKFRGDDGRGERTSESCSGSSDHRFRTFALSQNEYPILRVIGQLEA